MSYSSTTASPTADRERLRGIVKPVAAAVLVSTVALTVYGAHNWQEIAVVLTVIVATTVGVYGFLVPRKLDVDSAGGTALTLSLIGLVLLLPAFWSGLPLVLGAAGAILGYAGRSAVTGAGRSTAALALGALSSIGYFAIYVLDTLRQYGVM